MGREYINMKASILQQSQKTLEIEGNVILLNDNEIRWHLSFLEIQTEPKETLFQKELRSNVKWWRLSFLESRGRNSSEFHSKATLEKRDEPYLVFRWSNYEWCTSILTSWVISLKMSRCFSNYEVYGSVEWSWSWSWTDISLECSFQHLVCYENNSISITNGLMIHQCKRHSIGRPKNDHSIPFLFRKHSNQRGIVST